MTASNLADLDRLKTRIQGLRSKTTHNGCTEAEALQPAAKVTELRGRYKMSAPYRRFRHQHRHMANSSCTLGMVASIADKLKAMKTGRDAVNNGTGRDLVVVKASVVDAELGKLDLKLRRARRTTRMV